MNIIDKKQSAFKPVPKSLDGEVMLDIHKDSNGNVLGYVTAAVDVVASIRATPAHQRDEFWTRFNHIIDSDEIKNEAIKRGIPLPDQAIDKGVTK